jgi:hypothetical protein
MFNVKLSIFQVPTLDRLSVDAQINAPIITILKREHSCQKCKSESNGPGTCVIDPDDFEHLVLSPQILKAWATHIVSQSSLV